MSTAAAAFADLCTAYAGVEGVTLPTEGGRAFGSSALKVNGSIFAMLVNDRIVLKLPGDRVAALVDARDGVPFDSGRGRPMKEWVALADAPADLAQLVAEAKAFVGNGGRPRPSAPSD